MSSCGVEAKESLNCGQQRIDRWRWATVNVGAIVAAGVLLGIAVSLSGWGTDM